MINDNTKQGVGDITHRIRWFDYKEIMLMDVVRRKIRWKIIKEL